MVAQHASVCSEAAAQLQRELQPIFGDPAGDAHSPVESRNLKTAIGNVDRAAQRLQQLTGEYFSVSGSRDNSLPAPADYMAELAKRIAALPKAEAAITT